jgi:uncharacterized protein DUF1871
MALKTTDDYVRACQVTQDVINRWDPYGLLASGAPAHEFEPEAASVVRYIPRIRSATDAATAISEVFSEAFEPQYFTREHCLDAGRALFTALIAAGIIDEAFNG